MPGSTAAARAFARVRPDSVAVAASWRRKAAAVMQAALTHAGVVAALGAAVGPNVKCMQSMLFIKGPGKPGQEWHQDEFFIPTRDRSLCGVWIALDDATTLNGC